MTYLAMEMVLYLVSAALIGTALGWAIWGGSHGRKIARIHHDMTTAIEAERSIAAEAREELARADDKLQQGLEAERARSEKALIEVRQQLETEKQAASQARSELKQLRQEMEEAVHAEKASSSTAIHETMQYAEDLKVAAREAQARETQIRADLEELRLMAGAEKLAAQSARAELDKLKTAMASSVEAERQTSAQARTALDEIRATLARTFGEGADLLALAKGAGDPVALDGPRLPEVIEMPPPRQIEGGSRQELDQRDHDDVDQGLDPGAVEKQDAEPPSAPGPGIAEGLADEAAASPDDDAEDGAPVGAEMAAPEDPDSAARAVIEDVGRTAEPALLPADLNGATRPPSFYAERPHEVDSLQAIEGIDPKIEELLNRNGCYQIRQLAHLTADDIDWLGRAMVDLPDLKERIERDGWIEQARELDDGNYLPNDERPRWWNRRRLQ